MSKITEILNRGLSENSEVRAIQVELMKVWDSQKHTGFSRLNAAYRFFTAIDDSGQMVFSHHCESVWEMRNENDGKTDFNKFVSKNIDLTTDYFSTDWDQQAEATANAYVKDQISRLANYIVKIAPMEVTE